MASEAHSYGSDLLNQPFELTALEVALKEICQSYAAAEKQLEALISPACDALLKKVRTPVVLRHATGATACGPRVPSVDALHTGWAASGSVRRRNVVTPAVSNGPIIIRPVQHAVFHTPERVLKCDMRVQVTTATLENLRRLKTRHQRLLSQVRHVADVSSMSPSHVDGSRCQHKFHCRPSQRLCPFNMEASMQAVS